MKTLLTVDQFGSCGIYPFSKRERHPPRWDFLSPGQFSPLPVVVAELFQFFLTLKSNNFHPSKYNSETKDFDISVITGRDVCFSLLNSLIHLKLPVYVGI